MSLDNVVHYRWIWLYLDLFRSYSSSHVYVARLSHVYVARLSHFWGLNFPDQGKSRKSLRTNAI